MEISIDILSVQDIDDILLLFAKRRRKISPHFTSICKMSMEISIDILPLLSVNPIRICKVFSQIFTKKEQILLKPFISGKSMVF